MKIHVLHAQPTRKQLDEMLEALEDYVKLAVDIRRSVVAGGGILHADCEAALLEEGSNQEDIWGADWIPSTQDVRYEALINIRPRQANPSVEIQSPQIRERVDQVARRLLGGI